MTENKAREEICRVGASLFQRGYVHSTSGNISVRLDDGYLITPTDACLGFLDPAQISKVDLQLKPVSGLPASKTLSLHETIYQTVKLAPQAGANPPSCVIHTHSSHLVSQSLSKPTHGTVQELLEPLTAYFVMKVGHVPHIPYRRPGDAGVLGLVLGVLKQYADRGLVLRALMLERLGPIVWHGSAAQAMACLEELEETAKLAVLTGLAKPAALSPEQIEELRQVFKASW